MRKAAAACATERQAWVQAALLWQLLGRGLALEMTIAPALVPGRLTADLLHHSSQAGPSRQHGGGARVSLQANSGKQP